MEPSKLSPPCISTDELPVERCWGGRDYCLFEGFWYNQKFLQSILTARSHFEAHNDDVIVASSMKTGTTWLLALRWSIMNPKSDDNHDALVKNNPHALIPSLELDVFHGKNYPNIVDDLSGMSSPRLFYTHVPYMMLSNSSKESGCKIVYVTRDPKDVFVSLWHFINANTLTRTPDCLDEAFDKYCKGIHPYGPFHDHVLSYWNESLKRPEKILFLKYEELTRDPKSQVQKLSSFLGRPMFVEEEIDKIIWRCSLDRLKNLEVNQNANAVTKIGNQHKSFFRLGSTGDWKNYLSMEMKEQLNNITHMKFQGSGLDVEIS